MQITIQVDTDKPITEAERNFFLALAGGPSVPQYQQDLDNKPVIPAPAPTPAPKAEKPKPAPKAEKPAPEPVAEAPADGPTLDDAVKAAMALVSTEKKPLVKAALDAAGAKRVGELVGDQIKIFMDALSA